VWLQINQGQSFMSAANTPDFRGLSHALPHNSVSLLGTPFALYRQPTFAPPVDSSVPFVTIWRRAIRGWRKPSADLRLNEGITWTPTSAVPL
jgi:hypothetical protein